MARRLEVWTPWLALAAAAGMVVAVFGQRFEKGDIFPAYSSWRADPFGSGLLYDGLQDSGRLCSRLTRAEPDPAAGLPDPDSSALLRLGEDSYRTEQGDPQAQGLLDFARRGGLLVVAFKPRGWSQAFDAVADDAALSPTAEASSPTAQTALSPTAQGLGPSAQAASPVAQVLPPSVQAGPRIKAVAAALPQSGTALSGLSPSAAALSCAKVTPALPLYGPPSPKLQPALPVYGPPSPGLPAAHPKGKQEDEHAELMRRHREGRTWLPGLRLRQEGSWQRWAQALTPCAALMPGLPLRLPLRSANTLLVETAWQPLYGHADGEVAATRVFGRGRIVVLADSFALSNEGVRQQLPGPLLAAWLQGRRQVVFDERGLGVSESPSLGELAWRLGLGPALGVLALLGALWLWAQVQPLLPLRERAPQDPPAVAGQLAALLRGQAAATELLQRLAQEQAEHPAPPARQARARERLQAWRAAGAKAAQARQAYQDLTHLLTQKESHAPRP